MSASENDVFQRELAYHEKLYSGFAQTHFARPAVRALRAHMARRILRITGAAGNSRVLSLGCGIGDTELLLAPYVRELWESIYLPPLSGKRAPTRNGWRLAMPASKKAASSRALTTP
jgi:hypothetical protein